MKKERTKQFTLNWPIEVDGSDDITELTISRPKGRDMMIISRGGKDDEIGTTALLMGLMTGLTQEQVEDLDGEDFARLSEEITDFLPESALRPATSQAGDQ